MRYAYENLANAIVELAVLDYRKAKAQKNLSKIRECENFFNSEWCKTLTQLDMPSIARRL